MENSIAVSFGIDMLIILFLVMCILLRLHCLKKNIHFLNLSLIK